MKAKHGNLASKRRDRSLKKGPRKATTFRLYPLFQERLALLGRVTKMPLNRLVNQAVGEYIETLSAELEADLEETLHRLKAYRTTDPHFESAIAKFAETEAALAAEDPVEGKAASSAGPAQRMVRELLRG